MKYVGFLKLRACFVGSISNLYSRIVAKTVVMENVKDIDEILEMIKSKELVVREHGYVESKIQLYYVNEFKKLLENIGFENVRFNPLIVLATTMPKDIIGKHFSRIVEAELELSRNPNLLPLDLRTHFTCSKALNS